MKLKLVTSDAETGEVLQEATDLTFAMMCFATEDAEGLNYESKITTNDISAYGYATCLQQVHKSATKAVAEAPQIVQDITLELSKDELMKLVDEVVKSATDGWTEDAAAENKEEATE